MRVLFISTIIIVSLIAKSFAQTQPVTPETPIVTSTTTSSSSSSHTISTSSNGNSKTSVSVKRNESVYKFRAIFDKSKTEAIKQLLLDKLGKTDVIVSNRNNYVWEKQIDDENVLECKLTKGNLRILVNKNLASSLLMETINDLELELKASINQ